MTPDQIIKLVAILAQLIEQFMQKGHQPSHLDPVRRIRLQRAYALIEANISKLSPEQLASIQPQLDQIKSLLEGI